ncbi:hypothetical protein D3230_03625 [Leucobacter chromiireducens subsp. solipictus]|uniref:Uncharacterized protein n=1 Tax=Leucobacter chromiireducens subsp. solipictus TaxID=398235 RepID=A0ABS1SCZ2_9MICO|nr:hypothetical protein [Leucobacter chromiireducens subsp. solipictus]
MLDARCSMLDARCSALGARCSMLDARAQSTGHQTLGDSRRTRRHEESKATAPQDLRGVRESGSAPGRTIAVTRAPAASGAR